MVIESLVKTVLSELKIISQSESVIGEPIEAGEVTLIPVSKISLGFAIGGGQIKPKQNNGEGTGGGISIEPQAFIAVQGNDIRLISLKSDGAALGKIVDLIPVIGDKLHTVLSKKDNKTKQTDGDSE